MKTIRLVDIVFDAGTQVRAALDPEHVASIAEAMTAGATIPPIVLFHDGNGYYIGDGFHRFMAAQRNHWREIDADVQPGAKADALWFALGANRTHNALPMKPADKRHAIVLALKAWPEKTATHIADQIGCGHSWVSELRARMQSSGSGTSPNQVIRKDGKSYPASRATTADKPVPMPPKPDKSRAGVAASRARMREMAAGGHHSTQIAAALGMNEAGCRNALRKAGIDVPADRILGRSRRLDPNRIVGQMAMDAENLTAGVVNLIDFSGLDPDRVRDWVITMKLAHKALGVFIRRLEQEQKHVQVA